MSFSGLDIVASTVPWGGANALAAALEIATHFVPSLCPDSAPLKPPHVSRSRVHMRSFVARFCTVVR